MPPGTVIYVDDGLIGLTVKEVVDDHVITEVVNGGKIGSCKGVNIPNVKITLPFMCEKDKK